MYCTVTVPVTVTVNVLSQHIIQNINIMQKVVLIKFVDIRDILFGENSPNRDETIFLLLSQMCSESESAFVRLGWIWESAGRIINRLLQRQNPLEDPFAREIIKFFRKQHNPTTHPRSLGEKEIIKLEKKRNDRQTDRRKDKFERKSFWKNSKISCCELQIKRTTL